MLSMRTLQELTRRWSKSAVYCYQRNCTCSGCFYQNLETNKNCNMKAIVLEMIRVHGKPTKYIIEELNKEFEE